MSEAIRVLLVDDHVLFRESLTRLLGTELGIEVVGGCATVAEGKRYLDEGAVDIVLLDYDLGHEAGTDLMKQMDLRSGGPKVLMVTAGMSATVALSAANAGLAGVVLKHSDPRQLVEAIRRVAAGESWWDGGILSSSIEARTGASQAASTKALTERQQIVLRNILDGLTNKEIAAKLESSETAVKATIQELFHKAGVRTRGQLVRVAIERYSREWLRQAMNVSE